MKQVLLAPNKMPTPKEHKEAGRFPLLASVKMDGRRCLIHKGQLLSRTMKRQPNLNLPKHLAGIIKHSKERGLTLDGELYAHNLPFGELESILKGHDTFIPSSIAFHCFDVLRTEDWGAPTMHFAVRASWTMLLPDLPNLVKVPHALIEDEVQLQQAYEAAIADGYEGLILRNPNGLYKHGRATVNEGIIFKMKAFETADAKVVGWKEQQKLKSDIERTTNEMGKLAKTYKEEDFEPANTMGALIVVDERGREFSLGWGRGWTHAMRQKLWRTRHNLLGQWVEFRYMVAGEKDVPRMPQLLRFREAKD